MPHSVNRTSGAVLGGTGVGSSLMTDGPSQNIPLSNPQGISVSADSDLIIPLSDNVLNTCAQNKRQLFGSGIHLGPLDQSSELDPQYYVTEPPDSPKASLLPTSPNDFQPTPNSFTPPNSPPLQSNSSISAHPLSPPHPHIVELNSPVLLPTPKPLDLTLSNAFKSLAIKRKA
ncbi:hypothetical protein RHMOL_Rhmol09G0066400 [Rhododendron molle]|uniref:Uncharacterized protein n=1 Tax=Rhododendron molle TaxID=49168 RepID=A0ACC0MBQ3_RHOML|nr:hypothetical protein RHMOL_Rhmol09G0066400 [Rhododendron molle]